MTRLFYSQQREDAWIAANLILPEKGFYVDIGCGHPFTTSNTAFLRDMKWDGLAVDANAAWAEDWKNIPAFCCSVISNEPEVSFFEDPENRYQSRIDASGGRRRVTETVEELLARFDIGKIDFLSVDTEGTEFEILKSFNFEYHEPTIVVAEYNAAHLSIVSPDESPIPNFMSSIGYSLKFIAEPVNMIFVRC